MWVTREMLESEAWRTAPLHTRRLVDRLIIEHMNHGGHENGNLICTYDDFVNSGVRRNTIKQAQDDAARRGLIYLVARGKPSSGPGRRPSIFGLGWLPGKAGDAAPNRWKDYARRAGYKDNIYSSNASDTLLNGSIQPKTNFMKSNKVTPTLLKGANKVPKAILGKKANNNGIHNHGEQLPPGWTVRKSDADGHVRIHDAKGVALPTVDDPLVGTPEERAAIAEYKYWQTAGLDRAIERLTRLRNEKEKRE